MPAVADHDVARHLHGAGQQLEAARAAAAAAQEHVAPDRQGGRRAQLVAPAAVAGVAHHQVARDAGRHRAVQAQTALAAAGGRHDQVATHLQLTGAEHQRGVAGLAHHQVLAHLQPGARQGVEAGLAAGLARQGEVVAHGVQAQALGHAAGAGVAQDLVAAHAQRACHLHRPDAAGQVAEAQVAVDGEHVVADHHRAHPGGADEGIAPDVRARADVRAGDAVEAPAAAGMAQAQVEVDGEEAAGLHQGASLGVTQRHVVGAQVHRRQQQVGRKVGQRRHRDRAGGRGHEGHRAAGRGGVDRQRLEGLVDAEDRREGDARALVDQHDVAAARLAGGAPGEGVAPQDAGEEVGDGLGGRRGGGRQTQRADGDAGLQQGAQHGAPEPGGAGGSGRRVAGGSDVHRGAPGRTAWGQGCMGCGLRATAAMVAQGRQLAACWFRVGASTDRPDPRACVGHPALVGWQPDSRRGDGQ